MNPVDPLSPTVKATTDAVFEEGSPIPAAPASAPPPAGPAWSGLAPVVASAVEVSDEQPPPVDPAVLLVPTLPAAPQPPASAPPRVGDYVRELGQEFQEQQDEGRL